MQKLVMITGYFNRIILNLKIYALIRMSLALLKTAVPFRERLLVKDGRFKGRYVGSGAIRLADELQMSRSFGKLFIF